MFGFIDLVALPKGEILGIQATSRTNISSRVKKIIGPCKEKALAWYRAGGAIQVWGWDRFDDGWRCKVVEINFDKSDEPVAMVVFLGELAASSR